ncbi:MAG: BON domain-containing protein [Terriglobales bacterium]
MPYRNWTAAGAAVLVALAMAGCSKSNAGSQDQAITQVVQKKLNADTALAGDNITASTQNGVVTLTGTVTSNAARAAAAQDARLPGVTQVDDEIATNTPATDASMRRGQAPDAAAATAPAAPAPPATVEISSGRTLSVRLAQALSSSHAQAGQSWQGQVSKPLLVNGQIAIPQGAAVDGTIVAADAAGHFKGESRLVLKLTTLEFDGSSYDLSSRELVRESSSRGKNSAEKIGGGAALGALIGALAGHGKGAAIGAAAGAGTGTAVQAFTKAAAVNLAAETVLNFTLSAPLKVVPAAAVRQ